MKNYAKIALRFAIYLIHKIIFICTKLHQGYIYKNNCKHVLYILEERLNAFLHRAYGKIH